MGTSISKFGDWCRNVLKNKTEPQSTVGEEEDSQVQQEEIKNEASSSSVAPAVHEAKQPKGSGGKKSKKQTVVIEVDSDDPPSSPSAASKLNCSKKSSAPGGPAVFNKWGVFKIVAAYAAFTTLLFCYIEQAPNAGWLVYLIGFLTTIIWTLFFTISITIRCATAVFPVLFMSKAGLFVLFLTLAWISLQESGTTYLHVKEIVAQNTCGYNVSNEEHANKFADSKDDLSSLHLCFIVPFLVMYGYSILYVATYPFLREEDNAQKRNASSHQVKSTSSPNYNRTQVDPKTTSTNNKTKMRTVTKWWNQFLCVVIVIIINNTVVFDIVARFEYDNIKLGMGVTCLDIPQEYNSRILLFLVLSIVLTFLYFCREKMRGMEDEVISFFFVIPTKNSGSEKLKQKGQSILWKREPEADPESTTTVSNDGTSHPQSSNPGGRSKDQKENKKSGRHASSRVDSPDPFESMNKWAITKGPISREYQEYSDLG